MRRPRASRSSPSPASRCRGPRPRSIRRARGSSRWRTTSSTTAGSPGTRSSTIGGGVSAGPTSTLIGCSVLNWLMLAVVEWLRANGHQPPAPAEPELAGRDRAQPGARGALQGAAQPPARLTRRDRWPGKSASTAAGRRRSASSSTRRARSPPGTRARAAAPASSAPRAPGEIAAEVLRRGPRGPRRGRDLVARSSAWREAGPSGRSSATASPASAAISTVDDSVPVLELATRGGPGLVIHAGTGSFVAARTPDGAVHYAGGIGWRFGDEGSGYDLGRRAIARALLELQGWAPPSGLGALVRERTGKSTSGEVSVYFYGDPATNNGVAGTRARGPAPRERRRHGRRRGGLGVGARSSSPSRSRSRPAVPRQTARLVSRRGQRAHPQQSVRLRGALVQGALPARRGSQRPPSRASGSSSPGCATDEGRLSRRAGRDRPPRRRAP